MSKKSVAIIGAGVSGLANAKWCKQKGLEITVFEGSDDVGGIWNAGKEKTHSPVWKQLHLNTPRVLDQFSDFPAQYKALFPSQSQHQQYLRSYAEHFGIMPAVRLNTKVTALKRLDDAKRWQITSSSAAGEKSEDFDYAVVCTGRYHNPVAPQIPGLSDFPGRVVNAMDVWDVREFADKRVVIIGCGNTALELGGVLAAYAENVTVSMRTPRYVLGKYLDGKPMELQLFNRFTELLSQITPPPELLKGLQSLVVARFGDPHRFGGLKRNENLSLSGLSLCEGYLHALAEEKLVERPHISSISGSTITFEAVEEGGAKTSADADVIIVCCGYEYSFPYLPSEIRDALFSGGNTKHFLDLYNFTWLDSPQNGSDNTDSSEWRNRIAFGGLWPQEGAYAVPMELQARYISGVFSGLQAPPTPDERSRGLSFIRQVRSTGAKFVPAPMTSSLFARAIGAYPDPRKMFEFSPSLAWVLVFGGCMSGVEYRMCGPDAFPDRKAEKAFAKLVDWMYNYQTNSNYNYNCNCNCNCNSDDNSHCNCNSNCKCEESYSGVGVKRFPEEGEREMLRKVAEMTGETMWKEVAELFDKEAAKAEKNV